VWVICSLCIVGVEKHKPGISEASENPGVFRMRQFLQAMRILDWEPMNFRMLIAEHFELPLPALHHVHMHRNWPAKFGAVFEQRAQLVEFLGFDAEFFPKLADQGLGRAFVAFHLAAEDVPETGANCILLRALSKEDFTVLDQDRAGDLPDIQRLYDPPGLAGVIQFADGLAWRQPKKLVIQLGRRFHRPIERRPEKCRVLGEISFFMGVDKLNGLSNFVADHRIAAALFADFSNQGIARRFAGFDPAAGKEMTAWNANDGNPALFIQHDAVCAGPEFIILIRQSRAEGGNVVGQSCCPSTRSRLYRLKRNWCCSGFGLRCGD